MSDRRRRRRLLLLRAAAVGSAAIVALAPAAFAQSASTDAADFGRPWPFPVGEVAEYDVSFGPVRAVRVGRARLAVEARDSIGGDEAYRLAFELEGGPFFYKIDDRTVSWLATNPYRSLRFEQVLKEGGYRRHRRYEMDHAAGTFTREDWDEDVGIYRVHARERDVPIPDGALDEIAYLYLVRTLPLEIGHTYRFSEYFEESGNPFVLHVLRREEVRVRAGRFQTIVVQPIIQTDGMFGEGGQAEVYLTDDDRRLIVQIRTRMKVGELNLFLREFELPAGADAGADEGPRGR